MDPILARPIREHDEPILAAARILIDEPNCAKSKEERLPLSLKYDLSDTEEPTSTKLKMLVAEPALKNCLNETDDPMET
jgi:hypothetical protein